MKANIEKEISYGLADKLSEKTILTCCRQKSRGQTVTIFSVGDSHR